jgi:hypothetical protein
VKKLMLSVFVFVSLAAAATMAAAPAVGVLDPLVREGVASAAMAGVVDPYLRVQAKLAADTIEGMTAEATAIATAAAKLGKDGAPVAAAAQQLQAAATIDAAREAFSTVTTALFAYADATKTDLGPDVRRTFCPMENKSWAQKNGEIMNPYAGKKMLHCGVFTDKK